ncbi:Bestrophin, RFP-TM, chloride channel-domain-containing protein [Myxozyma melibiosi]|uniref:Bestrophin, RFP-TM, chloride channel-domain-containing protein n=1 Tax=Myxozyma melibiosi TaxID=54550 RepID=A0ABR1FFY7_9ASCO
MDWSLFRPRTRSLSMISTQSSAVSAAGVYAEPPRRGSILFEDHNNPGENEAEAEPADETDVNRSSSGFFGRPHDPDRSRKQRASRNNHHKHNVSMNSASSATSRGTDSKDMWDDKSSHAPTAKTTSPESSESAEAETPTKRKRMNRLNSRRIKSGFKKLLLEDEINEFLNSKVHDDPFARSSLPYALRFRGGIFWSLVPQMCIVTGWATLIVCISILKHSLGIASVLITMLGFVTGLALSFRVNTAYERYNEGRKYWAQLTMTVRNFSRFVWIQVPLRKGHEESDFLMKVVALKLMVAFSIALKHHLREELGTDYDDLRPFVDYLPTYAQKRATVATLEKVHNEQERKSKDMDAEKFATEAEVQRSFAAASESNASPTDPVMPSIRRTMSVSSAFNNFRRSAMGRHAESGDEAHNMFGRGLHQWLPEHPKISEYLVDRDDRISRATVVHGNLPLEILNFLALYCRELQHEQGALVGPEGTFFFTFYNTLSEIMTGTERILRTPLPLAYNILCNQLAWIFVLILPFQLVSVLEWVAIPATVVAGYVILGLAAIGLEIENPFGFDANDLDLDRYCQNISVEVAMMMSNVPYSKPTEWMHDSQNRPLAPVFNGSFDTCLNSLELEDMQRILQQTIEDPSVRFHLKKKGHSRPRRSTDSDRSQKSNKSAKKDKLRSPSTDSPVANGDAHHQAPAPVASKKQTATVAARQLKKGQWKQSVILEEEVDEADAAPSTPLSAGPVVKDVPRRPSALRVNTGGSAIPSELRTPPTIVHTPVDSAAPDYDVEIDDDSDDAEAEEDPLRKAEKNLPRLATSVMENEVNELVPTSSNASRGSRSSAQSSNTNAPRERLTVPGQEEEAEEDDVLEVVEEPRAYDLDDEEDAQKIFKELKP